jgi:hypothetical protein
MSRETSLAYTRAPPVSAAPQRLRLADVAFLTAVVAVIAQFSISMVTLEVFGIPYTSSGGGLFSKVHPGTLLICLALALRCLASSRPLVAAQRLFLQESGVVLMFVAVAAASLSAIVIVKSPFTPLIDTFVLPPLCYVLLRDLTPARTKALALLVTAIFCLNAVLALIELVRGAHFVSASAAANVSFDPTRPDAIFDWRLGLLSDWRALAIFGHPLVNGLLVSCFILVLLSEGARWLPLWFRLPVLLLQASSMFAFGARSSIVLAALFGAVLIVRQIHAGLKRGYAVSPQQVAIGLFIVALIVLTFVVLLDSGLLDRTLERFSQDAGSAETRSTMFELFGAFRWNDLIFGPDQDILATWQRVLGLEFGIESSWIGLLLTYGFLVTGLLIIGLIAFSLSLIRSTGRGAGIVLLCYFVSVSGTASLSGKVTSLALVVMLCLFFLHKDERPQPLRLALKPRGT